MFATYKKIISPDSSPVLGPASPNLAPTNANVNNLKETGTNNNHDAMESLSLCNYCCSARNDKTKAATEETKPKYEFGHATHYTYNITSPRLLCDFETGTPP
jgi:hypothetical protein